MTDRARTDDPRINCPHCGAINDVDAAAYHGVCYDCRGEVDADLDDPEVVCLCGSTRFKDEYRSENRRLTMAGKVVLSVGLFGHSDDVELTSGQKAMLDAVHKRKIDLAHRVHVINVGGYVGDSTSSEIEYARETGTEVSWYDPRGES